MTHTELKTTPLFGESTGSLYDSRQQIGILAGNDVSALILLNRTVPKLVQAGYKPVIYLAEHRPSSKAKAQQKELQDLSFYERYLTNNVIYPLLESGYTTTQDDNTPRQDILYTPGQLAEVYGLDIATIDDINDPEFAKQIAKNTQMPLVISVRCYQIAHEGLIQAQTDKDITIKDEAAKGAIWNMHPGKLPDYQGIFGPLYAMDQLQRTYAWTLHEMIYDPDDEHNGIDKGPAITQTTGPIDYTKPAIDLYMGFARRAGDMLYDRIENFFDGNVPTTPQSKYKEGRQYYYSHPDPSFFQDNEHWPTALARLVKRSEAEGFQVDPKIKALVDSKITAPKIVDPQKILETLPGLFVQEGDKHYSVIHDAVEKAINDWEAHKDGYLKLHREIHPDSTFGVIDTMLVSGRQLPNGFRTKLGTHPSNDVDPSSPRAVNAN